MRVHAKIEENKPADKQRNKQRRDRESMQRTYYQWKPYRGKQICEAYEEANKHVIKQKGVS